MKSSFGPWYLVKVKYTKQLETGELKRVTESFLLPAISYTDAEAKATKTISQQVKGELIIGGITKANFAEVLQYENGDFPGAYVVSVALTSFDADSEKSKKSVSSILVVAEGIIEAIGSVNRAFVDSVSDFEVVGAKQSSIVDIINNEDVENVSEEDDEADWTE